MRSTEYMANKAEQVSTDGLDYTEYMIGYQVSHSFLNELMQLLEYTH